MGQASRLICMATAFAASVLLDTTAQARTVYAVQTDNWYVASLTNSCIAFNRLMNEYNQSPWNSLTIHAPKGSAGFLVDVAFWSKSFAQGSRHSLSVRANPGDLFEIDADAVYDHALKTPPPIPDQLVKQLKAAAFVTVGTRDLTVSLTFDTTRIDDVLDHLDNCRRAFDEN